MTNNLEFKFSESEKQHLQNLLNDNDFPGAYRYVSDIMSFSGENTDSRVINWLNAAANINEGNNSFESTFVRSATIEAANDHGMTVTNELFQLASDDLARNVLEGFVSDGGVKNLDSIISEDVQGVVDSFGLSPEGWAGTFAGWWPMQIGGLDLGFDSPFYSDLFSSYSSRGAAGFFEGSLMAADIFENNLVGLSGFAESQMREAYSSIFSLSDNYSGSYSSSNNYFGSVDSLQKSFTSLGLDNFDLNNHSWSGLGSGNTFLDNQTFDFGGNGFTLFSNSDRITLPAFGGFGSSVSGGSTDWKINSYLSENVFGSYLDAQNRVSPLVLDLNKNGIETTGLYDTKVFFDIDADGFAEKVGWVKPTEGLLAIDTNNNGKIDDITELFGDDKQPAFDKLRKFDSNHDGKINASDTDYNKLLVWKDLSQDGRTNSGELQTLQQAGVTQTQRMVYIVV